MDERLDMESIERARGEVDRTQQRESSILSAPIATSGPEPAQTRRRRTLVAAVELAMLAGVGALAIFAIAAVANNQPSSSSEANEIATVQIGTLDGAAAYTACESYGDHEFPYGSDWPFIDYKAFPQGDKLMVKATVNVTNANNAKRDYLVECLVSGTGDDPVVESFNAY